MAKNLSLKDAIKQWEEKTNSVAAEAKHVKLNSSQPLVTKLDSSLSVLQSCEHLSLSTNLIEKISNLQGLSKLKILSLGRNSIKKIEGLEAVADTLEQLWISYNQIERLNGIECCKKLKVLFASNNKIKAWDGLQAVQTLPHLEELLLLGNPLEEKLTSEGTWVSDIAKKIPQLKKLDGRPIFRENDLTEGDGNE